MPFPRMLPTCVMLAGLLSTLQILGQVATSPTQTTDPTPGDGHGWVIERDLSDPNGFRLPDGRWFDPGKVKADYRKYGMLQPSQPPSQWVIPFDHQGGEFYFGPPQENKGEALWPLMTPEVRSRVKIIPLRHVEVD